MQAEAAHLTQPFFCRRALPGSLAATINSPAQGTPTPTHQAKASERLESETNLHFAPPVESVTKARSAASSLSPLLLFAFGLTAGTR
jgi:hypothetical protein